MTTHPSTCILQVRDPRHVARPRPQRGIRLPGQLVSGNPGRLLLGHQSRPPDRRPRAHLERPLGGGFRKDHLRPGGLPGWPDGRLGPTAITLAHLEGLDGHAQAVARRLALLKRCDSTRSYDAFGGRGIMSWVKALARPDIVALKAYEHAAWEPGLARLHANELPWRAGQMNRSPGSTTIRNRSRRCSDRAPRRSIYVVAPDSLLVSRGSDEAIDLSGPRLLPCGRGCGAGVPADLRHVRGGCPDPGRAASSPVPLDANARICARHRSAFSSAAPARSSSFSCVPRTTRPAIS